MAKGKKTGGIQKGYKYPKTIEFAMRCDENNFFIAEEMIKLFKNTSDQILKFEILKEMAKYRYAQPKDHNNKEDDSNQTDSPQDISISDILHAIDVTPKKKLSEK